MGSLSLGDRLDQEVEIYVEVGPYGNKSEVVRRALEEFFRRQAKETRLVAAVHAYKAKGVTVSRAAEIGGVPWEEMRKLLRSEGVLREGMPEGSIGEDEREARAKALAGRFKERPR